MDKFNIDANLAQGSEIYIMAQVGHFPHLEQPEIFNSEVLRALR
jgi:pimeloyl-ACP methyl ester carboxylesterase